MYKYVPENIDELIDEEEFDNLVFGGFLDGEDRYNKSKQVRALKEQFLSSIENSNGARSLFDRNIILDDEDENFEFYEVNLNEDYYHPQTMFNMFVAANINLSDYKAIMDPNCKAFSKHQLKNRQDSAKYFDEFVKNGGNVETLKTMLAKQQRLFLKDNKEDKDNPAFENEELVAMHLRDRLNSVVSPYDRVFEISSKIAEKKKQINKMLSAQDYSMQDKLEAEVEALQTQLDQEAKKFDPEMLADVAKSKQERIKEEEKLKAEIKGMDYENQPVVINSDEYNVARGVEAYAEKQIRQNAQNKEL